MTLYFASFKGFDPSMDLISYSDRVRPKLEDFLKNWEYTLNKSKEQFF